MGLFGKQEPETIIVGRATATGSAVMCRHLLDARGLAQRNTAALRFFNMD